MRILSFFGEPQPPTTLPSSHQHLKEFRHMWRNLFSPAPPAPLEQPLRNIVAVGANYRGDAGLEDRDKAWLSHTLEYCHRQKVPVPPDFTFTPVNLANGHDFLNPRLAIKADIVMVCFVINPDALPLVKETGSYWRYNGPNFLVSDRHSRKSWGEAAKRTGARLVVTFDRGTEIGSSHFNGDAFRMSGIHQITAPGPNNCDNRYWMSMLMRTDLKAEIDRRNSPKAETRAPS